VTQEVVSRIPLTTADEFRAAVDAARTAFPGWRGTPVTTRQRVMFKFQELIRANMVTLCLQMTSLLRHSEFLMLYLPCFSDSVTVASS
jgi:malonate-semialdehyde dehydrogenase (acetylating)/methylmalonate-semialdehyde dehydrogenase